MNDINLNRWSYWPLMEEVLDTEEEDEIYFED